MLGVELVALRMHFENWGSICEHFPSILVYLEIDIELGQEGLEINLVLDDQKARLEVLSEGHIIVDVSFAWWLSAPSADLWGTVPITTILSIVADPLEFPSAVLLKPSILISILVFIYNSNFWLFQILGWEVPD